MRRALRWWWLLPVALAIVGLLRLRFDVQVLNLLPDDLRVVQGLKLHQAHFTQSDELILVIEGPDATLTETAARQIALTLRAQTNLVAQAIWQPPTEEHPEQLPELLAAIWLNQPPEQFAAMADRLSVSNLADTLESARNAMALSLSPDDIARLGHDPFGLSRVPGNSASGFSAKRDISFGSSDGTLRLVTLKPPFALPSYRETIAWLDEIRAFVENVLREENLAAAIRVRFTGGPAFAADISSGMENDVRGSVTGTLLVIVVLFWLAHRRWLPLVWLMTLLLLTVMGTLALGGFIFGALNVISLGFGAILLGLAVDYALVLYQEGIHKPESSVAELRRELRPGILWSAVTTAAAFLLLNFAGLPGLAQLGTLVALGVMLAAFLMLFAFLPVALKNKNLGTPSLPPADESVSPKNSRRAMAATVLLLLVCGMILEWHFPKLDNSADALSPRESSAYDAAMEIESRLTHEKSPYWLLVSGKNPAEVSARMNRLSARFDSPAIKKCFQAPVFPIALWPNPENQRANIVLARGIIQRRAELRAATLAAGFTDEAFALTDEIFKTWQRAAVSSEVFWPTNLASRWLLDKFSTRTDDGWLVLGLVPAATEDPTGFFECATMLESDLIENGAWLTGWHALGTALLQHTETRAITLATITLAVLMFCLFFTFRTARELLLTFATLLLSLIVLLSIMSLFGWSWNLMNLTAIPLLLGAGVDYTIHTQLAMRRHEGNVAAVRRTTGRALILCGGTTIAGFGSLSWASNLGLASLGKVCAAGMASVLFVSYFLLPAWWRVFGLKAKRSPASARPSQFYRSEIWRLGLLLGRALPARVVESFCRGIAAVYWHLQPGRREIVIKNLLPVVNDNRTAATRAARKLFRQFALKLADLWRYESGADVNEWPANWQGWEIFTAAHARGKGVLIVTPHLGNWEIGASFFARHGIPLLVLTQPEPGARLTQMRQAARARRGIETLVVGEDAFAFVEIIKRLQAGATVALLVDRPPAATAVDVKFLGRPFKASVAAAELARASGCAIVPACIVRKPDGYQSDVLPEVNYDRAMIGDRTARIQLTQKILEAFESTIREHPDQWYHFVPVWPETEPEKKVSS